MGCDFSTLVRQDFTETYSNLQKSIQKIHKKHERMQKLLHIYKSDPLPHIEGQKIRKSLCDQLDQLQVFIENLKQEQDEEEKQGESMSLSISSSFEEAPRPPISNESREKLKDQKASNPLSKSSKGVNSKLYTTESILEDPEIMALISKNRDKLMKKLTK